VSGENTPEVDAGGCRGTGKCGDVVVQQNPYISGLACGSRDLHECSLKLLRKIMPDKLEVVYNKNNSGSTL